MRLLGKVTQSSLPVVLLLLGTCTVSMAGVPVPVPEIDASSGLAAVGLVMGGLLIVRSRRPQK